jgi:hypothetical protein
MLNYYHIQQDSQSQPISFKGLLQEYDFAIKQMRIFLP